MTDEELDASLAYLERIRNLPRVPLLSVFQLPAGLGEGIDEVVSEVLVDSDE